VKIEWDGRVYDLDLLGALMSQADRINSFVGCKTMSEWESLLLKPDDERFARAVTAAYWLMLTQDGQETELAGLDIPFMRFFLAIGNAGAALAAEAAAAEADPTNAAAASGGTSPETPAVSAG
jgi:hypothetical protein